MIEWLKRMLQSNALAEVPARAPRHDDGRAAHHDSAASTIDPATIGTERGPSKTLAKQLALVIDLNVCVGCHACVTSCKEWNTSGSAGPLVDQNAYGADPTGTFFNRVQTYEAGIFPLTETVHFPKSCLHCEEPPCVPVCPTGASYKRAEDGIVLVDYDKCIGCKYCAWACPYGAREIDEERQVMTKCTLCVDRIYDPLLRPRKIDNPPASRPARPARACSATSRIPNPKSRRPSASAAATRSCPNGTPCRPIDTCRAGRPRRSARPRRPRRHATCRDAMNPAFSVIVFTTAAGTAQGLVVALALALLGGMPLRAGHVEAALAVATVLLVVGLAASFLHLGRPSRAWRAASMWRTSWLSREVIVLPAFIGLDVLWWWSVRHGAPEAWTRGVFPVAAIAVCALLWVCTAMIYACLRFIEEWAHPLTLVNFVLMGLASGFVLAAALAALADESTVLRVVGPAALVLTLGAGAMRLVAMRRNARIRHRSDLQSATGIRASPLRQTSMGMSAGSFNTREFFHRASVAGLKRIRLAAAGLGFAVPALLALAGIASGSTLAWLLAVIVQALGLTADRWVFFAQAKHPQNLYYQVVS